MIERILSGGQTGTDRAGLDFAIENGLEHGGWVPKGRLAEDGQVPAKYKMAEHAFSSYPPRTEANVREADATVIFTVGPINDEKGCLLTASLCLKLKKPFEVINLLDPATEAEDTFRLAAMLSFPGVKVLNVAGARGSLHPDLEKVKRILRNAVWYIPGNVSP